VHLILVANRLATAKTLTPVVWWRSWYFSPAEQGLRSWLRWSGVSRQV